MTKAVSFIVSGGGIGGLAAALALAQDGYPVTVLEQAASFGEIGAGIQLGPNVFRMCDLLRPTDAVTAAAFFPPGLSMHDVITGEKLVRALFGGRCQSQPRFCLRRDLPR